MPDEARLDRMIDRLVDDEPAEWPARAPDGHATATMAPDDAEALELLRLLDELGAVNRAFQRGEYSDFDALMHRPAAPPQDAAAGGAQGPESGDALAAWGRYRLEEKIGHGGFGSVYRGWDPVLQMPVAIKILHRRHGDAQLAERLIREGQLLAQVKHPNVVRVLNVEEHEGRVGLVMEYLRGETLEQMVNARGMLNHREATVIAEDVCRALTAVHVVGLVHRDVKARNIIREHDGRIVLMDFGAGMSFDSPEARTFVGTPLYMAPELLRGGPATLASDVYAVGVLLYFLVTRRYPYEGHTVDDIRVAHARGRMQALLSLRADLPQAYGKVVERALATDPRERFSSPGALLQALLDARTTDTHWRQVALYVGAGVAALATVLTLGGAITSGVFNAALGRQAYATEGVVEWFVLGRRSMLLPLLLTLLGVGVVGLLLAIRSVLLPIVPIARVLEEAAARRARSLAESLGVFDPGVASGWLVLVTGGSLLAVWIHWAALISAVFSSVSTAPPETLAILGPSSQAYQANYRVVLALLASANAAAWYVLWRLARARGLAMPSWLVPTQLAMLVLLYGSMQVTYRLVYDSDQFPRATWQSMDCFVLGERSDGVLLFCPSATARVNTVSRTAVTVVEAGPGLNMFAFFEQRARPSF